MSSDQNPRFLLYIGDDSIPGYIGITISHEIRIHIVTNQDSTECHVWAVWVFLNELNWPYNLARGGSNQSVRFALNPKWWFSKRKFLPRSAWSLYCLYSYIYIYIFFSPVVYIYTNLGEFMKPEFSMPRDTNPPQTGEVHPTRLFWMRGKWGAHAICQSQVGQWWSCFKSQKNLSDDSEKYWIQHFHRMGERIMETAFYQISQMHPHHVFGPRHVVDGIHDFKANWYIPSPPLLICQPFEDVWLMYLLF